MSGKVLSVFLDSFANFLNIFFGYVAQLSILVTTNTQTGDNTYFCLKFPSYTSAKLLPPPLTLVVSILTVHIKTHVKLMQG